MSEINRPKLLIAEDNAIMANVLRRILELGGFNVQIENDGLQALGACGVNDFDAIVTDYQMPHMDGFEFIKALRCGDRNQSVPVIFVSGKGLELDPEALLRDWGVRKVMFKPFSPRELMSCLHDCLNEQSESLPT